MFGFSLSFEEEAWGDFVSRYTEGPGLYLVLGAAVCYVVGVLIFKNKGDVD